MFALRLGTRGRSGFLGRRAAPARLVKVAAYQARLRPPGTMAPAVEDIRAQVERCEAAGVEVLCCPEGVLGGLADNVDDPAAIALDGDGLRRMLEPLASDRVTTIVGFTEAGAAGEWYCSAAVVHRGEVLGVYRKTHPAIRRSVYSAGDRTPTFRAGALRFGIVICYDTNFEEPARTICSQGVDVLFVPTNNGLLPEKADVVSQAHRAQASRAVDNEVTVVAADVAGRCDGRISYGSSTITAPAGTLLAAPERPFEEDLLLVAEVAVAPESSHGTL